MAPIYFIIQDTYISAIDVRMRLKDSVSTPKAQFMVRDPDDPSGKQQNHL